MRWLLICCLAGFSDSTSHLDGSQDDVAACSRERCGDPEAPSILYPGDAACDGDGCERALAGREVYVPPRNGRPWGDTYLLGTGEPLVIAGYSSGRIALLRRLALVGDGRHAVMLDPLWPDGERDFLGRGPERGEELVRAWLRADPRRTFLLIYSAGSAGWYGYAALQQTDVGARVKVCSLEEPHLLVPAAAGIRDALVDPEGWDNGACSWGTGRRGEARQAVAARRTRRGQG
jgi:hypothetical protein